MNGGLYTLISSYVDGERWRCELLEGPRLCLPRKVFLFYPIKSEIQAENQTLMQSRNVGSLLLTWQSLIQSMEVTQLRIKQLILFIFSMKRQVNNWKRCLNRAEGLQYPEFLPWIPPYCSTSFIWRRKSFYLTSISFPGILWLFPLCFYFCSLICASIIPRLWLSVVFKMVSTCSLKQIRFAWSNSVSRLIKSKRK